MHHPLRWPPTAPQPLARAGGSLRRWSRLAALGSAVLAGCSPPAAWDGGWVGASHARGHRLAKSGALDSLVPNRRQLVDRFEEAWTAWKAGTTFADDGSEDYDADAKAQIAASARLRRSSCTHSSK